MKSRYVIIQKNIKDFEEERFKVIETIHINQQANIKYTKKIFTKGRKFMNILLLAFALPVATILLAIVLQKILKCPLLVAATFFAILLIITYAVFDSSFLVFAILYTILAYVTAVLTRLICNLIARFNLSDNCNCICNNNDNGNPRSSCNNSGTYQVASGTWCCRARNTSGTNRDSNVMLLNNETGCSNTNGLNNNNEPVIVLTNANQITNSGRSGRNGRNYGCNCR